MNLRLLSLFLFFAVLSIALASITNAEFVPGDCFAHYNFQNGLVFENFHTDKATYNPGDTIIVSYTTTSYMQAPIVQGSVKAQILFSDSTTGTQNIIDEFFVLRDVNLQIGDSLSKEFRWSIPTDAKPGKYLVNLYFIVADRFNLAGINFIFTIPGKQTNFEVTQADEAPSQYSNVYFDQAATLVNNELYPFIGFPRSYDVKESINIKTKITNDGAIKKSLAISIETYSFDEGKEQNKLESKSKQIEMTLNGGESGEIEYSLEGLTPDVYLIKLIAWDGERNVAMMKIRIPVSGVKGIFNYLGLDKFPVDKNQAGTIFFCTSEFADYATIFEGHGYVEVVDLQNDKVLAKENFGPINITPSEPQGYVAQFTAPQNLNKIKLRGFLYDDKNNLMDSQEVIYDTTKFASVQKSIQVATKWTYAPSSDISYTVSYKDKFSNPVQQTLMVYLTDSKDKMIYATNASVDGTTSGKIAAMNLPHGNYKLAAMDLANEVKGEASFGIWFIDFDMITALVIVVIIIVVAAALVFILLKRKVAVGDWDKLYKKYR